MLPEHLKLEKIVMPTRTEAERMLDSFHSRHPSLWLLAQAMNRAQFGAQLLGGLTPTP